MKSNMIELVIIFNILFATEKIKQTPKKHLTIYDICVDEKSANKICQLLTEHFKLDQLEIEKEKEPKKIEEEKFEEGFEPVSFDFSRYK
jgi:hypothetical protein